MLDSMVLDTAFETANEPLSYKFTLNERRALEPFFTNLDGRVFFMHSLPSNVMATLTSMFSRLKNPRGIRGVFVDSFLPSVLVTKTADTDLEESPETILKRRNIRNLEDFIRVHPAVFDWFLESTPGEDWIRLIANARKARTFLASYLDAYGHNSIARMGTVWICFERISILAAKSIEWGRPGAGYVELSTRFVDMNTADVYPVDREVNILGFDQAFKNHNNYLFRWYRELQGDKLDGPFPAFLREKWGSLVEQHGGKLELGVAGETFDVLGNLLPAGTLTSVAVAISGEALPIMLKHLALDDTPENHALIRLVLQEAGKIGADQFARHWEPTESDVWGWRYLNISAFNEMRGAMVCYHASSSDEVLDILQEVAGLSSTYSAPEAFLAEWSTGIARSRKGHDKLPREFEVVTIPCMGLMSFRSWRDAHRQSFSTHRRTILTNELGFYQYDKPRPGILDDRFLKAQHVVRMMKRDWPEVPPMLLQYLIPLGFNVGFLYSANLRQHEFCNWQRTKPSVNHEARQTFLAIEDGLRRKYPWWHLFSRANMTPAYVFARGSEIPLPPE